MYLSANDVIQHIIDQKGRYSCYIGAGVSVEAQPPIKIADQICKDLRSRLMKAAGLVEGQADNRIAAINERLKWDRIEDRYFNTVKVVLPNQDSRVNYFRELSEHSRPGFCHHGIALLIRHGYFKSTCITTNFDKLLEAAFILQNELECQPIRTEEEARFWESAYDGKFYILKLHGDYDTYNIVNTAEETIKLSDNLTTIAKYLAEKSGMLVLGTAGYEQSIRRLFDDFAEAAKSGARTLSAGLLWGVYMGERDPGSRLSRADLATKIKARIDAGVVSPYIANIVQRMNGTNPLFAFFPIWSSGSFIFELIRQTEKRALIGASNLLLDHTMRVSRVFLDKGLSADAVDDHIAQLNKQREKLRLATEPSKWPEEALRASPNGDQGPALTILYGDITSRSFMDAKDFKQKRRAVVSPEDTFLSAGGGVALGLLQKAGEYKILNELSKFSPITQGRVAVTSGGDLPVHYLIHAAAIEVSQSNGKVSYSATQDSVRRTTADILSKAVALEIDALWMPLMGTGVAGLGVVESLDGILLAVRDMIADLTGKQILIFVFQEKEFSRAKIRQRLETAFGDQYQVTEVE